MSREQNTVPPADDTTGDCEPDLAWLKWMRCVRPDCDLHVAEPGRTRCSGHHDNLGCARDVHLLVARLYNELEHLTAAGDALAFAVRAGRWDDALDAWTEIRDPATPDGVDTAETEPR